MYLAAQVFVHLSGQRLLACFLLRLPCRFDPLQVLRFDGLVPVAGARTLCLRASDVSAFHPVLLSVCGGDYTTLCSVLRSPLPWCHRPIAVFPAAFHHHVPRCLFPGGLSSI